MQKFKKIIRIMLMFCMAVVIFIGADTRTQAAENEIESVLITGIPVFEEGKSIAKATATADVPEGCVLETQWWVWNVEAGDYTVVADGEFQDDKIYKLIIKATVEDDYVFSEDFAYNYTDGIEPVSEWSEEDETGAVSYYSDMGTRTFTTEIMEVLITVPEIKVGDKATVDGIEILFLSNDEIVPSEKVEFDANWFNEYTSETVTDTEFEKEKSYGLEIILRAKEMSSFASEVVVSINGEEVIGFFDPKCLEIIQGYSLMTPIKKMELSGLPEGKAKETLPETLEFLGGFENVCEVSLDWCDENENSVTEEAFIAGKTYILNLSVNVFNGAPLADDFVLIIDGKEYEPTYINVDGGQAYFTITYEIEEKTNTNIYVVVILGMIIAVAAFLYVKRKKNK